MGEWWYSATILDLGTRWRWVVRFTPPTALPPGKLSLVPIGYWNGWAPEPVWTLWRREQSCPCREWNPGPSLYRLCHPDTSYLIYINKNTCGQTFFRCQDNDTCKKKHHYNGSSLFISFPFFLLLFLSFFVCLPPSLCVSQYLILFFFSLYFVFLVSARLKVFCCVEVKYGDWLENWWMKQEDMFGWQGKMEWEIGRHGYVVINLENRTLNWYDPCLMNEQR
jgi:hypothetical protein